MRLHHTHSASHLSMPQHLADDIYTGANCSNPFNNPCAHMQAMCLLPNSLLSRSATASHAACVLQHQHKPAKQGLAGAIARARATMHVAQPSLQTQQQTTYMPRAASQQDQSASSLKHKHTISLEHLGWPHAPPTPCTPSAVCKLMWACASGCRRPPAERRRQHPLGQRRRVQWPPWACCAAAACALGGWSGMSSCR